mmetsp:Transcript_86066/g.216917  ORF Transcript_86066/g.216917 Transcript_86066/m.216917 type:complete len:195 (+) Transcript_86066:181-765(+)
MASEDVTNRDAQSFFGFRLVLPELLVSGCGIVCSVIAAFIDLKVVKWTLGVFGLILLLVGVMLLTAKLGVSLLQQRLPPPSKVRTCVWAVSSFGELLAGGSTPISVEVISAPGSEADARTASQESSQSSVAHEPRLEQTTCPCCMQDFTLQIRVVVIRCGHIFCEPCLRSWAVADRPNGGACPVCRTSFELGES